MSDQKPRIAFFGTPEIAVWALEELEHVGIVPDLLVTNPDRPQGRALHITPPPTKIWANTHGLPVLQPESLRDRDALEPLITTPWALFIVFAYGLILPKWLIELPKHSTLNLHPSLLPTLRGPSPIRSALLHDMRETGVTIIVLDEKMDHGPIVAQQSASIAESAWPLPGRKLDEHLARLGGKLLGDVIPEWMKGNIEPLPQDHTAATYCKRITKTDGELHLDPDHLPTGTQAYQMYLKICAYDGWPGTFFMHQGKRIKITDAELAPSGELCILRVIPEGKKDIPFEQWLHSVRHST